MNDKTFLILVATNLSGGRNFLYLSGDKRNPDEIILTLDGVKIKNPKTTEIICHGLSADQVKAEFKRAKELGIPTKNFSYYGDFKLEGITCASENKKKSGLR